MITLTLAPSNSGDEDLVKLKLEVTKGIFKSFKTILKVELEQKDQATSKMYKSAFKHYSKLFDSLKNCLNNKEYKLSYDDALECFHVNFNLGDEINSYFDDIDPQKFKVNEINEDKAIRLVESFLFNTMVSIDEILDLL